MDISILFNHEVVIPATIFNSVLIVLVLSGLFLVWSKKVKAADPSQPSTGVVLLLELFVTGVEKICQTIMNDQLGRFAPFVGVLIVYLIVANLIGLVGLAAPASNYNVALSLAIFALGYLHFSGMKIKGVGKYFKEMIFGDFPALALLNIVGEISKVLSLSFRLFGNVLSGGVISFVVLYLTGWVALLFTPVLNFYFDIFSGLLQTMIFCFLMMIWLGNATATESE